MIKVGLTGGIGSGKSTVAAIFISLGVPVYVADKRAQTLMSTDRNVQNRIKLLLGDQAYDNTGELNRKYVSSRVFKDAQLLNELNTIVHPVVRADFAQWAKEYGSKAYVLQEAAILFESGGAALMDENIVVYAPEHLRLQRVMNRDHSTENEVRQRMNQQLNDEAKVAQAQFVIINDGAHSLIKQVMDIDAVLSHVNSARLA